MKKKLTKLSILLIICSLLQNIFFINNIFAANGTFTIALSKSTANQGDRVTLTITGQNAYGRVDISATNATIEGGSSVFLQNDSKQVIIIPSTAGKNVSITVKPSSAGVGDMDENPITDVRNATITVNAASTGGSSGGGSSTGGGSSSGSTTTTVTKSSNADLGNLWITPLEYDFTGFKPYKTEGYNVTVPYDVESIEVHAKLKDSKAKITSGTGTKKLKEGSNSLKVVVTAEAGNTKTYTINVVRMSEEEEMTPNVVEEEEKPEALRLTAISLQNDLNLTLSPAFDSETFEYTVEVESDLETLELSGIPNVNGAKVTIEGNDKLEAEENIITLTVKADGYEDVVYTIKVIKKATDEIALIAEETVQEEPTPAELDNSIANKKIILVISILAFIIIAIVVILVLRRKKNNKLYSSYYDYYNDYPNETEKLDVLKEMEENNNAVNENGFEESEVTEGYTAEIEDDPEYEEKPRRKRGKGKHF